MKKRFLSVFMVLCMMLTMVPSAFAEGADGDTLQNKINQASENATITLDKAYTESITIPEGKNHAGPEWTDADQRGREAHHHQRGNLNHRGDWNCGQCEPWEGCGVQ